MESENSDEIKFFFLFFRLSQMKFYKFYLFHDLIWSLLLLIPPIIVRIELYDVIFLINKDLKIALYVLISVGGFFLCTIISVLAYIEEFNYNFCKKLYTIWRVFLSFASLIIFLFILIAIAIFDPQFKDFLIENPEGKNLAMIPYIIDNFNALIAISSVLLFFAIINAINSIRLVKIIKSVNSGGENYGEVEKFTNHKNKVFDEKYTTE